MYKMCVKKINDSYYIELPYMENEVKINGKTHEQFKNGYLTEAPVSIVKVVGKGYIDHYINNYDDSITITVEEFNEKSEELMWKAANYPVHEENEIYTNDCRYFEYEGFLFKEIEDENAYRLFKRNWKPVWKNKKVEESIPFTIIDITGNTEIPEIVPFRFLGKKIKDDKDVLYSYNPNIPKATNDVAKYYGFEKVEDSHVEKTKGWKWSVPLHSINDLQFIKINGKYCHYKFEANKNWILGISHGTYEECLARYKKQYELIDSVFKEEAFKLKNEGKEVVDAPVLLRFLDKIKILISDLDVKVKSDVSKKHCLQAIFEFREKILKD